MLQRDNKADAYSPLSALAKRQSRLCLHGGKLMMFHTKFRSLIGFLCVLLIITVTVTILLIIVKKVNFSGPLVLSFCNLDPNVRKSLGN